MLTFLRFAAVPMLVLGACSESNTAAPDAAASSRVPGELPGTVRQYGTPLKVGAGRARSYVVLDQRNGGRPLEVGVALDATALDALPAPMPPMPGGEGHAHMDSHEYLLSLPQNHGTPYQFIELNWNPSGHEPPHIYGAPHFDFHFYTVAQSVRDAILPSDPAFGSKAASFPSAEYVPGGYMVLPPPPAPTPAVPKMGVHWSNLAAPELQPPDAPNYKAFTHTFIHGSWNGQFIFAEPMITRDFLLTKPDITVPLAPAARYQPAGYHPSAYRIIYDAQAKEYRIALSGLTLRN